MQFAIAMVLMVATLARSYLFVPTPQRGERGTSRGMIEPARPSDAPSGLTTVHPEDHRPLRFVVAFFIACNDDD
jgi:hypothetical protein